MIFIDICIINMLNNYELRRIFNCCDKKRREGMGYDKNIVDDLVVE